MVEQIKLMHPLLLSADRQRCSIIINGRVHSPNVDSFEYDAQWKWDEPGGLMGDVALAETWCLYTVSSELCIEEIVVTLM